MKHLENLDTNLSNLADNPTAQLELLVGGVAVVDIRCEKSAGADRFIIRALKTLAPKSGPVIAETPDRASVGQFLKSGFPGVFLSGCYRSASARLVGIPGVA